MRMTKKCRDSPGGGEEGGGMEGLPAAAPARPVSSGPGRFNLPFSSS